MNARTNVPKPINEPVLNYAPGSREKKLLKARIKEMKSDKPDIPLYIGGKEIRTGKTGECRSPHDQSSVIATYHKGGAKETKKAIEAALKARKEWSRMPFRARAAIFLKVAEYLSKDDRWTLNGATMLAQSKSVHQAEIDSACELIDFLRWNVYFAEQIYATQPVSSPGIWNQVEYRGLEGFVFAVTPFNFTAIAGNLPTAPALMGNTVVWKPAASTIYTAHYLMQLFKKAGLPDGVINMVTGNSKVIGETAMTSPDLAGVHFTGSTGVFHWMWGTVGSNIHKYKTYPRLVGETGGKDFIFVHPSADWEAVSAAMVRGSFEFQGQKCSASSRAYIPASLWPKIKSRVGDMVNTIKMGSPEDFTNYFNAVIDRPAYDNINGFLARAKKNKSTKILFGGTADDSRGFFIKPTVILSKDPRSECMVEEIFGPVLTVYVYPDKRYKETLRLCDVTSPYALTGAIFSRERKAILEAADTLVHAAGNFYINDKPTGAVVGQQPFGGSRASGTNDKAGSAANLMRWVSPRTIKETFDPPHNYRYPFLAEK